MFNKINTEEELRESLFPKKNTLYDGKEVVIETDKASLDVEHNWIDVSTMGGGKEYLKGNITWHVELHDIKLKQYDVNKIYDIVIHDNNKKYSGKCLIERISYDSIGVVGTGKLKML